MLEINIEMSHAMVTFSYGGCLFLFSDAIFALIKNILRYSAQQFYVVKLGDRRKVGCH